MTENSNPDQLSRQESDPRDALRSREETRRQEQVRFQSLLHISALLSSTLNLPRLLDTILQAVLRFTDTEASSILLIDRPSGTLYFDATSNFPSGQTERIEVPLEGSVAGWVIQHGRPRVLQRVKEEQEFTVSAQIDSQTEFSTDSLLAVPLAVKGQVIGVLEALNKRGGRPFDDNDQEMLMAMAGPAAIAIENARLFQQNDLVAEMVHELRTPLTALTTMSGLLTRPDLPPERARELAGTLQGETQRLTKMVSDFLDFARLESGRVKLKMGTVDLEQVIADTVRIQQPAARERGITIEVRPEQDLPLVFGDADQIKQVLLNLVSNAIKYNRPGGSIVVTAGREDDQVQVCVQDTGPGIPPDAMKHLFQRFYRVPDTEGYSSGTGLGLSIARRIVYEHGGRIWAESEWGQGSRFCFTIPLEGGKPPSDLGLDEDFEGAAPAGVI